MKNKSIFGLGVLLLGFSSLVSEASPAQEKKFYLFGGVDLGLATYSKSSISTDASRSGLAAGIRGLASFYSKQWVFDGGLGFLFVSSKGTNSSRDVLRVYTRTLQAGASARYRINPNWQIGPELEYWFGTDNGLNRSIFSSATNNALLGGIQGVYEWKSESDSTKYRVGAKWNMDLNIQDRNLNLFQLFFQIGFSPFGGEGKRSDFSEELRESDLEKAKPEKIRATEPGSYDDSGGIEPEPEVMSTPAPVQEPTPLPIGPQEKMVITLDVKALPFDMDSARLPKYNRDRVKEIGRFLGEHRDSWEKLVVSGHTDEQGKATYNLKLSQARADTVRQLLGEGGAPIDKITAAGMGSKKPIDPGHSESAYAKNRRVELEFYGVKDGLVIQKAFKKR